MSPPTVIGQQTDQKEFDPEVLYFCVLGKVQYVIGIIIDTEFPHFYNWFSELLVFDTWGRYYDGNTPDNLEPERMQMIWSRECSGLLACAFLIYALR